MELTLDDIISRLECDNQILQFKVGKEQFPIWPFVRHGVLLQLIYSNRGLLWQQQLPKVSVKENAHNIFCAIYYSPLRLLLKKRDFLYFNSGIGNYLSSGTYHNRLVDDFYYAFPEKSALIETLKNGKSTFPRNHANVYSHMGFKLLRKLLQPFYNLRYDSFVGDEMFRFLQSRLKDLPVTDNTWQQLHAIVHRDFKAIMLEYRIYRWFFKKVKPKMIFLEDAFHGYQAHLIKAAKEYNITVAEFQHGTVNAHHLAYNYGKGINNSKEYELYRPDFFLSYGKFWTEGIRNAAMKVSVGNPFISKQTINSVRKVSEKNILVLSSAVSHQQMRILVEKLLQLPSLQEYKISLRPHPLEKDVNSQYSHLLSDRFSLDFEKTILDSLAKCSLVISEYSTAAFDALMYGKPVLLFETEIMKMATPEELACFASFKLEHLSDQLVINALQSGSPYSKHVCEQNWELNFKNFVNQHINA